MADVGEVAPFAAGEDEAGLAVEDAELEEVASVERMLSLVDVHTIGYIAVSFNIQYTLIAMLLSDSLLTRYSEV